MFKYWYGILDHQVTILMLVRSFREADLILFISTLKKIVPLFFALDHTHYSRWLPVFIQDLEVMTVENPQLFRQFREGKFSVRSSLLEFSKMTYDQCHEQNNKAIKSTSGYINLVNKEDKDFLQKVEICSPEIRQFLEQVDNDKVPQSQNHKEQSSAFSKRYIRDCNKVYSRFTTNPFSAIQFQKINTPLLFPEVIVEDSKTIFVIGEAQYQEYVISRFITGSADVIQTPICRNSLKLPQNIMSIGDTSPQIKLTPATITKLRDACDVREDLARKLFKTEFTGVPECLVKDGKPYHNQKSQLLDIISTPENEQTSCPPGMHGLIVDLSVLIRAEAAFVNTNDGCFDDFVKCVLQSIAALGTAIKAVRIDIVADMYDPLSIKGPTRQDRGIGPRMIFNGESKLPEDFESFLKNDDNKTNLNMLVAKHAMRPQSWTWREEVVVTYNTKVLTSSDGIQEMYTWIQCVHEEADNRMLIYIKDMLAKDITNIILRTVDTDVIVILLAFMSQFIELNDNVMIWVDFGTGGHRRTISINSSFIALGESTCLALSFFHAFTGCDSTCSFYRKTKKIWFEIWMKCPMWNKLTTAFQQLSWLPSSEVVKANLCVIEQFVTHVFLKKDMELDDARYTIFSSSTSDNFREMPPSSDALEQHILRSAFQAGWVWGNTLSQLPTPYKHLWGWQLHQEQSRLLIRWKGHTANITKLSVVIATCKCSGACSTCTICTCGKNKMTCLKYCICKKKCISNRT